MSDPITAPLLIVRRLSSDKTHVMRVGSMTDATVFGASYKRPVDGWARRRDRGRGGDEARHQDALCDLSPTHRRPDPSQQPGSPV